MVWRKPLIGCALAAAIVAMAADAWAQARQTPYYASISAGLARMRTGPGRNYPASWLYRRAGLPIKVIEVYKDWRKIEDPGGTQGWMQVQLLTENRTGFIVGGTAELRDRPQRSAGVRWRAAPGVVGRISKCAHGWCWFDVRGRAGFVETAHLWGVDPEEEVD